MKRYTKFQLAVHLTILGTALSSHQYNRAREREEAARAWAPLVWLHPQEHFFPDDVNNFLHHVTPSTDSGQRGYARRNDGADRSIPLLPEGPNSQDYFLTTDHDFDCPNCPLPEFLHGRKPSQYDNPPVYAVIHSCTPPTPTLPSYPYSYSTRRDGRSLTSSPTDDLNNVVWKDQDSGTVNETYNTDSLSHNNQNNTENNINANNITINNDNNNIILNITDANDINNHTTEERLNTMYVNHELITSDKTACNETQPIAQDTILDSMTDLSTDNSTHHTIDQPVNEPNTQNQTSLETDVLPNELVTGNHTSPNISQPPSYLDAENRTTRKISSTLDDAKSGGHRSEEKATSQQIFTVTYWMFYPYNRGKNVCTVNLGYYLGRTLKPRVGGHCHGEEISMGDHVGDWEHVSIQFQGSTPLQMYISTHNFGAYYTYHRSRRQFLYARQDTRGGLPLSPSYPRTIDLVGSRMHLFSTKGSHGLWGAPGIHRYSYLPVLDDETGTGTPWRTWTNLTVVDQAQPHTTHPHRSWWDYHGRWGNPGVRCHLLMAGMCEVVSGPSGIPLKRMNFPCPS